MKKLYDLARGTVRVKASGANAESILNLCAENGIEFWDASPCSDFELFFTLHAADYPAVSSRSGKNGVEITLVCSRGGRQLTKSMKSRFVLLVLLCVCIILSAISSLFIWRIDVVGNDKVSAESLLRALDDCGVRYGAFWPAISSDAVKDSVVSTVPEIAWLSLNIRSSCARIVVHERIEKPEIVNEKAPCDIIASKSGVIKQMSVPMAARGYLGHYAAVYRVQIRLREYLVGQHVSAVLNDGNCGLVAGRFKCKNFHFSSSLRNKVIKMASSVGLA